MKSYVGSAKRISSFETIRALALLGVLFYHYSPSLLPSGYLGVPIFFVLAGFLCLRKTLLSPHGSATYSPPLQVLGQRLGKIYPPLLLLLLFCCLGLLFFFPSFLPRFVFDLRTSILGLNNIGQIIRGESYFEGAAMLKPLTHLWALSLEIQFYALFALLVHYSYRPRYRYFFLALTLLLALLSYALVFWLYGGTGDPTRVYYGSDTRMYAFLLGAALAIILIPAPKRQSGASTARQVILAILLLLVLAAFCYPFPLNWAISYGQFGFTLLIILILYLSWEDTTFLARTGEWGLISWLATRSYHIYLWHFPVLRFTERFLAHKTLDARVTTIFALSAAIFCAELSYIIPASLRRVKIAGLSGKMRQRLNLGCNLALLLILFFLPWEQLRSVELAAEPSTKELIERRESELQAQKAAQRQSAAHSNSGSELSQPSSTINRTRSTAETAVNSVSQEIGQNQTNPVPRATTATVSPETQAQGKKLRELHLAPSFAERNSVAALEIYQNLLPEIKRFNTYAQDFRVDLPTYDLYRHLGVTMIGDSVSVIASYYIQPYLPGLILDALSNRQMKDAYAVFKELEANGELNDVLVIALGSNGDVLTEDIEKIYVELEGRPLLLYSIVLPYPSTEQERNGNLKKFVQEHDNVWLVDWYANAKDQAEFFQEDSIHPSQEGCRAFCQLLVAKLMEICQIYAQKKP